MLLILAAWSVLGVEALIHKVQPDPHQLGKFDKVRVDQRNYDKVRNMHYNWYSTSIKAVMGQLGRELYSALDPEDKLTLLRCLDRIEEKKDLVESARCLVKTRKKFKEKANATVDRLESAEWIGGFRAAQSSKRLKLLNLVRNKEPVPPMTKIPPIAMQRRKFMGELMKDRLNRLQKRAKRSAAKDRVDKYADLFKSTLKVKHVSRLDGLKMGTDKNVVSDLISTLAANESDPEEAKSKARDWSETYDKLLRLKKLLEDREKEPGARAYSLRMYDLVLDRKTPSMSPKQSKSPQGMVQMAMTLFGRMSGDGNREERQGMNMNVLSPRFAPVMPDKVDSKDMHLSPTILSFYEDEGNKNNIASLPSLLKSAGVSDADRDRLLGALMKASGTTDVLEDALKFLENVNFYGIKDEVMDVTERIASVYEKLESAFHPEQHHHLAKRGFTFLEDHQIDQLYRDRALSLPDESIEDLASYRNLTQSQKTESLWLTVEQIASNQTQVLFVLRALPNFQSRAKRSLAVPAILSPTVLAPYMFAPVFGLVVLGPVVLSPSLFSPLILNPAMLSPYVLSPAVGMPFILSPYVLSPYVISPLVFAPFILNPYVLSPNVINPYLLSPLILSPLVLCPDVISPMALGGAVLSPSVASPAVLTETFLMASVLSPSFLSR